MTVRELPDSDGTTIPYGYDIMLKPKEAADIFRVTTRTLAHWSNTGRLFSMVSPTGRRLYPEECVRKLLAGDLEGAASAPTGTYAYRIVPD